MKIIFLLLTTILTLNITSDSYSLDCSKKLMVQDIQITCKRMTDGKDREPKFVIKLKEDSELTTPESDCTTTNCTITCQQLIALEDLGIGQHKLFAILYLTSGQVYSYSAEVPITLDFPSIALKNCDYDERNNITVHCTCERTDVSEIETWIYMYINDVEQYKTSGNNLQFTSVISGSTVLRCIAENVAGWRSNTASVYYNLPSEESIYDKKNAGMALAVFIVIASALYFIYQLKQELKSRSLKESEKQSELLKNKLLEQEKKYCHLRISRDALIREKNHLKQELEEHTESLSIKSRSLEESEKQTELLKNKLLVQDKECGELRISRDALVREKNRLKNELEVHTASLSIKNISLEELEKQTELLKNKLLVQEQERCKLRISRDALEQEKNHLKKELEVLKVSLSIKSRSLEELEKQKGIALNGLDGNIGMVSEELLKYYSGRHEVQECSKGQTETGLHKHLAKCKKNPGHKTFITVKNITKEHFPSGYYDNDLKGLIEAVADLTVRIAVKLTSPDRPEFVPGTKVPYPCYNTRGQNPLRTGTGWVKWVDKNTKEMNQKCPCPECDHSDTPSKEWWEVYVMTARHVVFDQNEARQSSCRVLFDEDKSPVFNIYGWKIVESNTEKNVCCLYYVTHDSVLGDKLEKIVKRFNVLDNKASIKYKNRRDVDKLTIIVSHPHGCSKQVSVGHWVDRKVHSQEVQGKMWTWYTYTNCTCAGSSGARVYRLGYYGCELTHSVAYPNSGLKCSSVFMERISTVTFNPV